MYSDPEFPEFFCFVSESANPNIQGWDGAIMSYVHYLYELGK